LSVVSIARCSEYSDRELDAALLRVFDKLGGVEKYVKPGMKVVLKPNLVVGRKPEDAATTHPRFVGAVARLLKKYGASVILAESPGGLYLPRMLKSIYNRCGMTEMAEKEGVTLNFDIGEAEVDNPDGELLKRLSIIRPVAEADLVINLPKLKSHGQMVYTGAVKNMFGVIAGEQKALYHFNMSDYTNFANALIDIFLSVKPGLSIMDAVIGMDGAGPSSGDPFKTGLVIGSENAFELDYTALKIIGADPMKVPVIRQAVKRGLCPDDISRIEVKGERLEDVRVENFKIPAIHNMRTILFYENSFLKFFAGKFKSRPVFRKDICNGCQKCGKVCPAKVIGFKNNKPEVNLEKCIRCFCCQELCPNKAILLKEPYIMKLLSKRRKILK
jgi:uncharacterized protein (DUF362 family)/Pyruvate/2-oxoacid:ferredoxin oxidoreductase delta subunit